MKTVIHNNSTIALASTKEYSSENFEYFRLRSSLKAYFVFSSCLWQPLILFSFADYFVWLHVTERYIYIYICNTGSYATVITLYLYFDIYLIQVHIYATIILLYNT